MLLLKIIFAYESYPIKINRLMILLFRVSIYLSIYFTLGFRIYLA